MPEQCPVCGYTLAGLPFPSPCPECGDATLWCSRCGRNRTGDVRPRVCSFCAEPDCTRVVPPLEQHPKPRHPFTNTPTGRSEALALTLTFLFIAVPLVYVWVRYLSLFDSWKPLGLLCTGVVAIGAGRLCYWVWQCVVFSVMLYLVAHHARIMGSGDVFPYAWLISTDGASAASLPALLFAWLTRTIVKRSAARAAR